MTWQQLISTKRFGLERYFDEQHDARTEFQRDYDRLIFSSSFRRLQNKTQVFPLPGSVFVHNRLTHSLEVASVGRSIGNLAAEQLSKRYADQPDVQHKLNEMGAIVAAACLAHDLGNPPFGHSGERAIGTFFTEGRGAALRAQISDEAQWSDFSLFEGNANAFRLLTHQFNGRREGGFVLTYSTLASVVKYPYASSEAKGKAKFGFFRTEQASYERVAAELGIVRDADDDRRFARHPLVFLVEAADDICYQIMDIEDACKLHIISVEETKQLLMGFLSSERQARAERIFESVTDVNEQIAYLRSTVIGRLNYACADAFVENETAILEGRLRTPLIKIIDPHLAEAYKNCSQTAFKKIYRSQEVLDVELAGYKIISELLTAFVDAALSPEKAYSEQLLRRVPAQYNIYSANYYERIQSVIDYISGMTDIYALDLYRKINGTSLPTL